MRLAILILAFLTLYRPSLALNVISDDETESVIMEIASPIFKAAQLRPQNINLFIVQDDNINAFVINGSNMFIHTGLIKFSPDPNVLAGVIAHETGHIIGGHVSLMKDQIDRMRAQMAVSALAAIAAGVATGTSDAAMGAYGLGQHLSVGHTMKFSRAQESAADEAAMKLMKKAHVNPGGLVKLLKFFVTEERLFASKRDSYFNTHPVSKERLNILERFATDFKNYQERPDLVYKFALVNAKIDAFTSKPESTLKKYPGEQDPALYAQAIALMKKGDHSKAKSTMQRLIERNPQQAYFYELLAQIYVQSKDINSASVNFEKALKLRPRSMAIKLEYADSLLNARHNISRAVELLTSIIDAVPDSPGAYHALSGAYALQNNKGQSLLALAYYHYLIGDNQRSKNLLKQLDSATRNSLKAKDLQSLIDAAKQDD